MLRPAVSSLLSSSLVLLTLCIFIMDAWTRLDIAIAVLYVVVILLSARVCTRKGVVAVGAICCMLTLVAYAISRSAIFSAVALGQLLVSLAALGITAFLTLRNQAATNALLAREEALRRSQAFLAGTQSISRTGSFSFKPPEGQMHWSAEAARIYGYPEHVIPTIALVQERVLPEDAGLLLAAIEQGLRADGPVDIRYRLVLPDGELRYVHVLANLIRDDAGQYEYLGALIDVTAEMLAEQALHRSQTQLAHVTRVTTLGELAASIAHEVNQPLAAISANAEACLRWIARPQPDLNEATAAVRRMLDASGRAAAVIHRVRLLARKGDPQHVLLDLNEVAEETALLVKRELNSHNVVLVMELAPALPAIRGDRVQLQQVIINLLINGMQAMASCAPGLALLKLRTGTNADGAPQLGVSDTGPGIADADVPQLFDAFFTTKDDGMGMGLPICRAIIEAHGGRIWAEPRQAKGAMLQFSLPAMRTEAAR
ncbi:sensor histidine kinase [Janthinobacterium agaricidamnosum]|uniref:histidine kinase n=1 Tax=Janthinobacterium agaricidamnosum NBRC 102515 = DSM 9628 TaxID=1349767 RepID=W0V7B6_9BURK|nr:ATP-binding protein [Janthinobacterium agaricidamnosum]CDG83162.1 sensory box protein [Janthinobacterium agaricidamnosum NBRC 102515 = DSM 9628]